MLNEDPSDERYVFRSGRRWKTQIRHSGTAQALGEIECAVRWKKERSEYAVAQRTEPTDNAREGFLMESVVEHGDQLGFDRHVRLAPRQSPEMRFVETEAERVERARLAAADQRTGGHRHERLSKVAVDLSLAPVLEGPHQTVANGRRVAGTHVVCPAAGMARQPDARWKPVRGS